MGRHAQLDEVDRVLPKYLLRIVEEEESSILKMWLLDDALPGDSPTWSAAQQFLDQAGGRLWLDQTTGDLIRIFRLRPQADGEEEGRGEAGPVVEVLSQRMPYTLAVQHLAGLFGIEPGRLPVLVGYLSLDQDTYCVLDLADAGTPAEVKRRFAVMLQCLREVTEQILGKARVEKLLLKQPVPPLSSREGAAIAEAVGALATTAGRAPASVLSWKREGREARQALVAMAQILSDEPQTQLPDLRLFVELKRQAGPMLHFAVHSRHLGLEFRSFPPVELGKEPAEFFETFTRQVADMRGLDVSKRKLAARRLLSKGKWLSDTLLPGEVREILDSLPPSIENVQILSNDGAIPWELLWVRGGDDPDGGSFLCEAVQLCRWPMRELAEPRSLPLDRIALVVADAPEAQFHEEARDLGNLLTRGRVVERLSLTELELLQALEAGCYDVWHFAAHGQVAEHRDPTNWQILLGKRRTLTLDDVVGLSRALRRTQPLVFLNSCSSGRSAPSLVPAEGWAQRFLRSGAAAFIGSNWAVEGAPARTFACRLYEQLLEGQPIARATRRARMAVKLEHPDDPSWLAYTVYAHPLSGGPG